MGQSPSVAQDGGAHIADERAVHIDLVQQQRLFELGTMVGERQTVAILHDKDVLW